MISRRVLFAISLALIAFSKVMAATIPAWLPPEYRFDVDGTSNEVRQVESTLLAMRNNIDHDMAEYLDSQGQMGAYLQWIVRWCRPGITNETKYLSKVAHPATFSVTDFNADILTNAVKRIRYLPTTVKLSLVYDDHAWKPVSRALPGVDYPGVAFEDEGSTDAAVSIVLRAPQRSRRFRIKAEVPPQCKGEVEFAHIVITGYAAVYGVPFESKANGFIRRDMNFNYEHASRTPVTVAFFARVKGGVWGPPSFVKVRVDELCHHHYDKRGVIESIDYGDYADFYRVDEKDRIIGFTRRLPGMIRGDEYSCTGELIVEAYPNEMPKVAHKVRYYVSGGKLMYEVLDEDVRYKHGEISVRSKNW